MKKLKTFDRLGSSDEFNDVYARLAWETARWKAFRCKSAYSTHSGEHTCGSSAAYLLLDKCYMSVSSHRRHDIAMSGGQAKIT